MVGDGEAVGLVAQAGHEVELGGTVGEGDGVSGPGHKYALGPGLTLGLGLAGRVDHVVGERLSAAAQALGRLSFVGPVFFSLGSLELGQAAFAGRDGEAALFRQGHQIHPLVAEGDAHVLHGGDDPAELALATVDDDQVGEGPIVVLEGPPKPAQEDLVHRSEVVVLTPVLAESRALAGVDALDLEVAVGRVVGLAVAEYDHGGDRVAALDVADVVTLDAPRQATEAQSLAQTLEGRIGVVALAPAGDEAARGVALGEHGEFATTAALGDFEGHALASTPLAEPGGERLGVVLGELEGQEDLVGDQGGGVVVGPQEAGQYLSVGELHALLREPLVGDQLAAAHVQDHELDVAALPVHADHVLVELVGADDLLALEADLDRPKLVADPGRGLEFEGLGRALHAGLESLDELAVAAAQEQADVPDLLGVDRRVDLVDAGGRAALDLILEAGPLAMLEHEVGAGPELEVAVDHAQGMSGRARRVVGAEVAGPVLADVADDLELGPGAVGVEAQDQVLLVVAKFDVEAGLVPLDEVVLEQHRLLVVGGDDRLDVAEELAQTGDELACVVAVEVLAYAQTQTPSLAHIDDATLAVAHDVDTRIHRQALDDLEQLISVPGPGGPAWGDVVGVRRRAASAGHRLSLRGPERRCRRWRRCRCRGPERRRVPRSRF